MKQQSTAEADVLDDLDGLPDYCGNIAAWNALLQVRDPAAMAKVDLFIDSFQTKGKARQKLGSKTQLWRWCLRYMPEGIQPGRHAFERYCNQRDASGQKTTRPAE